MLPCMQCKHYAARRKLQVLNPGNGLQTGTQVPSLWCPVPMHDDGVVWDAFPHYWPTEQRNCLAWQQQAITWPNIDKLSVRSWGTCLKAISQEMLQIYIHDMSLKMTNSKSQLFLPANELIKKNCISESLQNVLCNSYTNEKCNHMVLKWIITTKNVSFYVSSDLNEDIFVTDGCPVCQEIYGRNVFLWVNLTQAGGCDESLNRRFLLYTFFFRPHWLERPSNWNVLKPIVLEMITFFF